MQGLRANEAELINQGNVNLRKTKNVDRVKRNV